MSEHNVWQYYQGEAQDGFKESYARLAYLIKNIPAGYSVLNIGIGDGSFERLAQKAGLVVSSLDPDSASCEKLRKELGITTYCGSLANIPLSDAATDVIVVSEVLEHLTEDQAKAGLKECARVLRTSGFLIGTVPADENLNASIVACPCCAARFHRWGHQQSFSERSLKDLLGTSFSQIEISYRKFIPWKQRNLVYKISAIFKIILVASGIKVQNSNYTFKVHNSK